MPDSSNIDSKILKAIDEIRNRHNACTSRAVASGLRISTAYTKTRLSVLRQAGLVTWTQMPGSLRRVEQPRISDVVAVEEPVSDEPKKVGSSTPTKKVAKKTAASKSDAK